MRWPAGLFAPGGGRCSVLARPWLLVVLLPAVAAMAARPAQAQGKLVDLHGSILMGGMTGRGSVASTPDLFRQTEGAGLGVEVGARLLVLDLSARFTQMINGRGAGGTLLTVLFGPSVEIPVTGGRRDALGKRRPPEVVLRPSLAGGVCLGTLVPVDPPLTNDQLAAKGLLAVGRFAVERMYGSILGLGADVEGGYHYLLGASGVANGSDHSSGWQLGAFATLSFHLGV